MSSKSPETNASKPSNQKLAAVKKDSSRNKVQDTKTSTIPEKLMDDSPRSSPARFNRINSSSPMSSPTRTPKTYPRSPAITSKGYGYRCSRANRECQTSGMSPHIQMKAHLSHSEIA